MSPTAFAIIIPLYFIVCLPITWGVVFGWLGDWNKK